VTTTTALAALAAALATVTNDSNFEALIGQAYEARCLAMREGDRAAWKAADGYVNAFKAGLAASDRLFGRHTIVTFPS
jgi:hypothetical protein